MVGLFSLGMCSIATNSMPAVWHTHGRRGLYNPGVTLLDLIAVVWIVFSCFQGARRGLVANALSLIGFAAGAVIGSRLAPHLLAAGAASPWLPAATLVAALLLGLAARRWPEPRGPIRHHLLRGPLETVDTAGGLAVGAVFGMALVWLAAWLRCSSRCSACGNDVQRQRSFPRS